MTKSFKCTEDVKTTLTEELHGKFLHLAHDAGCSSAEALRDMVCMVIEGCTFGEHVANHRRNVLSLQGRSVSQSSDKTRTKNE